jgi:hypothetical protein
MSYKTLTLSVVLALALTAVPPVFAAPGDEVTITGTVVSFDSTAGTITLQTEDGTLYTVVAPEGYDFTSLQTGDTLKVEGVEGDDGSVVANEVETEDEDGDDGEDADGGEMPFQHPAALKIEETWGIPYDTVMDIFENGFTSADYGLEGEFGDYEGQVGFGRIMMAARLAEWLDPTGEQGLTWQWLLGWHLSGNGWGEVMAAYKLADKLSEETGFSGADLLEYRESGGSWGDVHQAARLSTATGQTTDALLTMHAGGMNWGQIRKELGVSGPPEDHGGGKPEDTPGGGPPEDHGGGKPEDTPGGGPPEDHGGGRPEDKPGGGPPEDHGGGRPEDKPDKGKPDK